MPSSADVDATQSHDADGNLVSVIDALERETEFAYNSVGELVGVSRPDGSELVTTYWPDGQVATQHDSAAEVLVSYDHDARGRVTSVSDALGRVTSMHYDAGGRLVAVARPGGSCAQVPGDECVRYGFDDGGRMTGVQYSDPATADVSFSYLAGGLRESMSDGSGTTSWSYDSLGRVASVTDGSGATLGYGYDRRGLPTELVYPDASSVTRVWDDAGRLESLTDWDGGVFGWSYDVAGAVTGVVLPGGVNETSYGYDQVGQLSSISVSDGVDVLMSLGYGYTDHGMLVSIDQTGLPGVAELSFDYDLIDQLTTVNDQVDYGYDPADNLASTPLASTQAFDVAHQLCWISDTASSGDCSSPPAGATTFGYDIFGNRTSMTPPSGPATTYSYDQADRLVGVSGPTSATYSYNGDGLRVAKAVDGTSTGFVWDTVAAMPVIVAEDDTYYLYGPNALPLARVDDTGEVVYYHLDHQGSVRMLTDADGEVVGTYSYDPYGNLDASTGSVAQPLGYTGQYLDAETGLYQLRARYYDPATGQFLSIDPMVGSTGEPYAYAGNNPMNYIDPLGLWGVRIGPIKIGNDGCLAGTNPNGSCRGSRQVDAAVSATNSVSGVVAGGAGVCALVLVGTPVSVGCGGVAAKATAVNLATGAYMTARGDKSVESLAVDGALWGVGRGAAPVARSARSIQSNAMHFGESSRWLRAVRVEAGAHIAGVGANWAGGSIPIAEYCLDRSG